MDYRVRTLRLLATTAKYWGRGRRDELALRWMHGSLNPVGEASQGAANGSYRGNGAIPRRGMAQVVGAGARGVES